MEKGLAIIEMKDNETKSVFIDKEVLEYARLNARTKKRVAKAEKAQNEAERNRYRAAKVAERRRIYTLKTIGYVLLRFVVCGAVAWAGIAGLIHPIVVIPVILFSLGTACLRLGTWIGKNTRR